MVLPNHRGKNLIQINYSNISGRSYLFPIFGMLLPPKFALFPGNHPIFKRPVSWTSRGKFQFHGGGDSADAHIGALIVV